MLRRHLHPLSLDRLPDWLGVCLLVAVVGSVVGWGLTHWVPEGPWRDALATAAWAASALGLLGALALLPRIKRSLQILRLAMAGSHDGMFEWDPVTKRLSVGRRLLEILGYTQDFLPTSDAWLAVVHPEDRASFNQAVNAHLKGLTDHFYCEYRVKAQNGEYRWLAARGLVANTRGKTARLMAGSVSDVTERVLREQHMRELALTDQLTGLPNRRCLVERLPAALAQATRQQHLVGLLFVDLDRFKNVNDTLGHWAGDELLKALSLRLPSALRPYDLLARQGGDELIVLLSVLAHESEANGVADRLLNCVAQPVTLGEHTLQIKASVGMALFPPDGQDADTLLRHADMAMYEAKARGGGQWQRYSRLMDERMSHQVKLENRLRAAIDTPDLSLHYQPQFDARTGQLVGAEALLRWQDGGQMVRPDLFIPVAEESGLIDALGKMVMHQALQQVKKWQDRLPVGFRLGVNLSPKQFRTSAVDLDWLTAAQRMGVDSHWLAVEVTESVLLDPDGTAIAALQRLRQAGFEVALDDFGTGYSSLSYLRVLELDVLKVDKSFVAGLGQNNPHDPHARSTAVVDATLAMAHRLGFRVVAEGVETDQQLAWLRAQGCDTVQGYLLGRPVPPEVFGAQHLVPLPELATSA
ncbi:MAG: GGDEF domain-containing protein [Polaromonas sp.]|nr:GGDEF domain-containing protein [Polaromonas sp.]